MRRLDSKKSAVIDLVEAAYDLPADESAWLERVLEAALSVMGDAYLRPVSSTAGHPARAVLEFKAGSTSAR